MNKSRDKFTSVPSSFWALEANNIDGQPVKFESLKGAKAFLIINVASECGYTNNYDYLGKFYNAYKDKGLQLLGFPCNQFGAQEPGNDSEIKSFCSLKYKITFPMFSKIEVNGPNTHPVYQYLRSNSVLFDAGSKEVDLIKWNFYMFLVDKDGKVVKLLNPEESPEKIEKDFTSLLN